MAAVGRIRHPSTGEHHAFTANGTMVKTFQAYLANCHRFYSCVHCRAHLANHDELISKVSRQRGEMGHKHTSDQVQGSKCSISSSGLPRVWISTNVTPTKRWESTWRIQQSYESKGFVKKLNFSKHFVRTILKNTVF